MGREDKPVIKILQLCFPHPFPLPPTLWALFSAVLSIGSLYQQLSATYSGLIIHLSAIACYFIPQLQNLSLCSELQTGLAFSRCLAYRAALCYGGYWSMGERRICWQRMLEGKILATVLSQRVPSLHVYFYQHPEWSKLMCCVLGHFLMFSVAGRCRMAPVQAAAR